jgi:cell division protein FtsL
VVGSLGFEPPPKWRCHPQIPLFLFCFRLAVALFVSRGATGARGRCGLGQETLTKTLLQQKKPRVKQGLHVKRKALALTLIIVTALSVASWLVYNQISELKAQNSDLHKQISELQDQNTQLQNQTSELKKQLNELQNQTYRGLNVEIIRFGGFNPFVGLTILSDANVTIQNNEAYDISGFNLTLTLVDKSTGEALSSVPAVFAIDTLHAFEIREIKAWAFWRVGDNLDNAECVVMLSRGNFVVDKETFPLS